MQTHTWLIATLTCMHSLFNVRIYTDTATLNHTCTYTVIGARVWRW